MFFSRRRRSGPDRFLPFKTGALMTGMLLGLIGMRLGSSLLVSLAIGIVLAGFVLRFVPDPNARTPEPDETADAPGPRGTDSGAANPR